MRPTASPTGIDFRPDYRRIGEIVADLSAKVPVLATTATANSRVVDDVAAQLSPETADSVDSADHSGEQKVMILRGGLSLRNPYGWVSRLVTILSSGPRG